MKLRKIKCISLVQRGFKISISTIKPPPRMLYPTYQIIKRTNTSMERLRPSFNKDRDLPSITLGFPNIIFHQLPGWTKWVFIWT